jgi:type I restriction enzyme S subunit
VSAYPLAPLAEVLTADRDSVALEPTDTYPTVGILSFGRGLFARPPITGAETSYKTYFRLRSGQFVYSRLFAWEGAVAVVPDEFDGFFVSPEFPTFSITPRATPRYLSHIARWRAFHEQLAGGTKGLGLRRQRVNPEQLLAMEIPLPSIEDQHRIADELDVISDRARKIVGHVGNATRLSGALPASLAQRADLSDSERRREGWAKVSLGAVMTETSEIITVEPTETYPNIGILSFGRGLFEKPPIDGSTTSAKKLNRIRVGQFIYSRLFAFEGAYASVPDRFDGHFVSGEFPTFDLDQSRLLAPYLAAYLKSEETWADLAASSKGLGVRRQRIHAESLLAYEVWIPPLTHQRQVVVQLEQLEQATHLRERTATLTAALESSALNQAFAGQL